MSWWNSCRIATPRSWGLENLTAEMLDQLPDLKIIARMGVGLDNVDPALLRRSGYPYRPGRAAPTGSLSLN